MIAARVPYEADFAVEVGAELIIAFDRSFSTVRLVKNGDVNPCFRITKLIQLPVRDESTYVDFLRCSVQVAIVNATQTSYA